MSEMVSTVAYVCFIRLRCQSFPDILKTKESGLNLALEVAKTGKSAGPRA